MKRKQYRSYTREFKREAVRLAESGHKPVAAVAREIGVHRNQIARWKVQLQNAGAPTADKAVPFATSTSGQAATNDELERLRRENARLAEENAILRKAAMVFAREAEK